MFVIRILEKIKANETKIFSSKCNDLIKMPNYEEEKVKLRNTQLNKLHSAAKKKRPEQHQKYLRKTFEMNNCHMNYL